MSPSAPFIQRPVATSLLMLAIVLAGLVGSGDATGIAVITQLSPIDVEFSIPQDLSLIHI